MSGNLGSIFDEYIKDIFIIDSPDIILNFNIVVYVLFILTLFVSYLLFRIILGRIFDYERHNKSPAKHYHHLVDTFIYGTVLFFFGNYSQCFSWVTALCTIIGLFGFAWIAELPFCKCSLQSLRTWDIKLKIICIVAVGIVLCASGYHFYLATQVKIDEKNTSLIVPYVIALIAVCLFIFISSIIVYKYQNMAFPNLKKRVIKVGAFHKHRHFKYVMSRYELEQHNKTVREQQNQVAREQQDVTERGQPKDSAKQLIDSNEVLLIDMPRVGYHLHHWQIFYYLAFFTRFDDVISQICAGLVIGITMHGVAAYGFHDLLEE